ncbi:MAG: efflux RND transporter periplasmic adaptor subunit [Planctomycetota bacterium]
MTRTIVGLVVLVVAMGIYGFLVETAPTSPRAELSDVALSVRTMQIEPVVAPRVWSGFGTARPKDAANVAAEVAGTIQERPDAIDPGAIVGRDELIVALDAREFEDRLSRSRQTVASWQAELDGLATERESLEESLELAREAVRLTQVEVDRLQSAVDRGVANRFELDVLLRSLTRSQREAEEIERQLNLLPSRAARLEALIGSERASLRLAELDVERCRITAPIDGVLQDVMVNVGERVSVGQMVGRIVDLRTIEVPLRLPLAAAGRVATGDRVRLDAATDSGASWGGVIARVAPEADSSTRTLTIFVEVTQQLDDGDLLLPGQFVMGRVEQTAEGRALLVPRSSVLRDRVLLVGSDERAVSRMVNIDYSLDGAFPALHPTETQWLAVREGVAPGDEIILSNLDDITAGMPVKGRDVRDEQPDALATDAAVDRSGS